VLALGDHRQRYSVRESVAREIGHCHHGIPSLGIELQRHASNGDPACGRLQWRENSILATLACRHRVCVKKRRPQAARIASNRNMEIPSMAVKYRMRRGNARGQKGKP